MIQKYHSWAYIQTKLEFKEDTHTLVFTEACFIIAKIWKQHKCPSTDEWIKMIWGGVYRIEYHSAIKKME